MTGTSSTIPNYCVCDVDLPTKRKKYAGAELLGHILIHQDCSSWSENHTVHNSWITRSELVQDLMVLGVNPNTFISQMSPAHKRTALHWACLTREYDAVKILISAGADIHLADSLGDTPMHAACALPDRRLIMILLKAGGDADLTRRNNIGETQLESAKTKNGGNVPQMIEECRAEQKRPPDAASLASKAPTAIPV